jgi:acid phosphatase type 7
MRALGGVPMKLTSIIKTLVLLLAVAILPFAAGQEPGSGATAVPDHIALSWTGDPSTTMTVMWRTDSTVASGFLQYQKGNKLSASAKQAEAVSRDFVTDLGATRLFASTPVNLSPNTKYSYRVGDGKHWSEVKSFSTADRKVRSFKFLVFGDSQCSVTDKRPYGTWHDTLQSAYQANPDARFMVNTGDLVDIGQRIVHWNAWFAASAGVIDTIPQMPVPGNHETFGSKDTTRPAYWVAQFTLPQNGPEGLKGQVYSYDYGPVHFVVLDSQGSEQKKYGDIFKIQQDWLDADLAASKARWKILFLHKPPFGVMAKRTNEDVKAAFCPIIDKHHVDLVFSGHDHGIARTYPIKNGVHMEEASQGTVYYVTGRSGQKTYNNLEKMPWNSYFHDPQDQPNYLVVNVTEKKITIHTVKQDGTVLDKYIIEKPAKQR